MTVSNLGDAPVSGADETPVLFTDKLPAGLIATSITPNAAGAPAGAEMLPRHAAVRLHRRPESL